MSKHSGAGSVNLAAHLIDRYNRNLDTMADNGTVPSPAPRRVITSSITWAYRPHELTAEAKRRLRWTFLMYERTR